MKSAKLSLLLIVAVMITLVGLAASGEDTKKSVQPDAKAKVASADTKAGAKTTPPQPGERLVEDPAAVKKATATVAKKREDIEAAIAKVKERKKDQPVFDLKAENETLDLYVTTIIPGIRSWREDILRDKPVLMTSQNNFIVALDNLIDVLRSDEQKGPDAKVRSQKIREFQNQLRANEGNLAIKYQERLKSAQTLASEVQDFLLFVEDAGSLLDQWEGVVLAMKEAGEQGDKALKQIEGLRDFARAFQDGLQHFFDFTENLGYDIPGGPKPDASQNKQAGPKPKA